MTIHISVAIISARPLKGNYVSDLEDDFFYHFGDNPYYLNTRIFTLEDVDKRYLQSAAILSVYDEDSFDLYRFLSKEGCASREVSMDVGDSFTGISKRIMLKAFGITPVNSGAEWKPPLFYFIEEGAFRLGDLEPLPDESPQENSPENPQAALPGDPPENPPVALPKNHPVVLSEDFQWDSKWVFQWDSPVTLPGGPQRDSPVALPGDPQWDSPVALPGDPQWDSPVALPGDPQWDLQWDSPVALPGDPPVAIPGDPQWDSQLDPQWDPQVDSKLDSPVVL